MKQLSTFVPEAYIKTIDYLVEQGHFPNRSEAVRSAIRLMIGIEMDLKDKMSAQLFKKIDSKKDPEKISP